MMSYKEHAYKHKNNNNNNKIKKKIYLIDVIYIIEILLIWYHQNYFHAIGLKWQFTNKYVYWNLRANNSDLRT